MYASSIAQQNHVVRRKNALRRSTAIDFITTTKTHGGSQLGIAVSRATSTRGGDPLDPHQLNVEHQCSASSYVRLQPCEGQRVSKRVGELTAHPCIKAAPEKLQKPPLKPFRGSLVPGGTRKIPWTALTTTRQRSPFPTSLPYDRKDPTGDRQL